MQDEHGTTYRPATRADCRDIARLFRISSEGVSDYVWNQVAEPGEDLLDVGTRRYQRENTEFSYQNCVIAERDGAIVGMLHSYPTGPERSAPGEDIDPVLAPYAALEAPGTLYISGVALYAQARGLGIGTRLMALAEERARALGLPATSLIVFEGNTGAHRLYLRLGYREVDRRPVVPHPLIHIPGEGDAILMVKDVA